jgi:hypothetical protein
MEDSRLARPAAKRRKNAAHGASRGERKKTEQAPAGRKTISFIPRVSFAFGWLSASSAAITD